MKFPLALRDKPAPYSGNQAFIKLWLHGKSEGTQRAYLADIERFLTFIEEAPLNTIGLGDVQAFADSLAAYKPATQARTLSAVKSLFSFASKIMPDAFKVNVGAAVKLPKWESRLAERFLPEQAVLRMLALETDPRNHAILMVLYYTAIRRAELVGLKWRSIKARPERQTGQITVWGKGGRERTLLLRPDVWQELSLLRGDAGEDTSVFGLEAAMIYVIVKRAAARAGITKPVSPHWMRHAHISHALNRHAPVTVVQQTSGHADLRALSKYAHAQPDETSASFLP